LRAFVTAGVAALPRVEISEAAAPATMAAEKVRLFIIMISLPSMVWAWHNLLGATRSRRLWGRLERLQADYPRVGG
jgi:hypothetical protein